MEVIYRDEALKDITYWKKSGQKTIQSKITRLIDDIQLHPYSGLGKPEALKHKLTGLWSREIDKKNRLIYLIADEKLHILSLRGHYSDK
ncbi:MAG: Txe/YoeB family addiction module toxin [Mangrovibacterium sp.]